MARRLILAALAAVALILLAAPGAASAAAEPFAWQLQLRDVAVSRHDLDMTSTQFAFWMHARHRQATIVENGVTYAGLSLRDLVGLVDDRDPATFNTARAAAGYNVVVLGMDGFSVAFTSAKVASLGDKLILASRAGGEALPVPPAFLELGKPRWVPDWPLRVVRSDPGVTFDDRVRGVVRVSIVPVSKSAGTGPFAWVLQLRNDRMHFLGIDMTKGMFASWARASGV